MEKEVKIFLIEDDPEDVLLIRESLSQVAGASFKFKFEHSENLENGLERLSKSNADVLLLDLSLPDSRGLDTFTKAHAHSPKTPIVVLTGLDDKTLGLEALWQGAQDYLVKGRVDGKMLVRVIRYALERSRVQSELRAQPLAE